MIYLPMPDLESAAELLGPLERGAILSILAEYSTGDARFLPNYWKEEEYKGWLRLYGRTILRKWYADHDDPKQHLVIPNDEETMTVWDYFHQPIKECVAPWFVTHPAYWNNHRGLLLKRNWQYYHTIFRDLTLPPVGFSPLIPAKKPGLWIVDNVPQEDIPDKTQPTPFKKVDLG